MGFYTINWPLKRQPFFFVTFCWCAVYGQIRYSIPEELQLGAFVGNIADDLGLAVKQLGTRSFRLVSGPRKQYLDVNLENGILFVKDKIDREELCGPSVACLLSFEVVLANPLNLYQVEVEVMDVNDNAPSFPKSQFRLEISEVAAEGARFPLECAHDPDVGSNSLQTYRLVANEYFKLNVETRRGDEKLPVLVLDKPLDREKQSIHRLTLIAKDGGVPERSGTAQIIINVEDANDNIPVFSQSVYRASLLENVPKGTLVTRLNATDLDDGSNSEIVYSFSSHTSPRVSEVFELNSRTGEIRVKIILNYEENDVLEFNVQAKDKGSNSIPAYCDVLVDIIDVNDNAPEVELTSLSSPVSEDSLAGTVVALISVTDKDSGENGQIQCQIPNHLPFALDSTSNKYFRLLTQGLLDRENISSYDITVMCSDRGTPPLTSNKTIRLEVSDINDNAPRFPLSLYRAHVMENNLIGASIFTAKAYDPDFGQNARISYSILGSRVQGEPVSTYVHINSENGIITSQRSFDYEKLKTFQVQVQAKDNGVPQLKSNISVDITVRDQNDNAPVIIYPIPDHGSIVKESVSRLAEPGCLVAKVSATDADTGQNGRLSYHLLLATDPGLFTISPDTGEIWTIRGIADSDANKQRLVIVAKDNGIPPLSAAVTIVLSVTGDNVEMLSDVSDLSTDPGFTPDLSLYLVISLATISSVFFVILVILAVKVHRNRTVIGDYYCCCFETRHSLNGIQKASRNVQIPPNYVEVFGGDPLSQSFRYGSYSTSGSRKGDALYSNMGGSSTQRNNARSDAIGREGQPRTTYSADYTNNVNSEVRRV